MNRLSLSQKEPKPVLVVGSVAFDNIITPYASGERILGGSAAYAALAASYYAPAKLVGVVGHDFDQKHVDRFQAHGIDTEGLQRDETGPTFFWKGQYHENFNRRDTLDIQLNVFETFRPELPESYKDSSYLMLGNIAPGLQLHVLDTLLGETSGRPPNASKIESSVLLARLNDHLRTISLGQHDKGSSSLLKFVHEGIHPTGSGWTKGA